MIRAWAVALACACGLLVAGPVEARRDRTLLGEAIKASRALAHNQLEVAETAWRGLAARAPNEPEVRWLGAEIAFHRGRYTDAVQALDGLSDSEVDGLVGQTRQLAQRSHDVTAGFVRVRSSAGHFELWHAPGDDEVIVELAGDALEAARAAFVADFGYAPAQPVRVELLGAAADLAQLSPLTEREIETTGTIALSKYGKLMVVSPRATVFGYPWMDTLAHEYLHLIVADLGRDAVPVWLQEGLARFAQTRWRAPAGLVLSAHEKQLLGAAVQRGALIGLDEMHPSLAKLPSQEAAGLAYAQVATLVAYVHAKLGAAGLRQIVIACADGKSAKRAVAEAMGQGFAAFERDWKAHLRARQAAGDFTTGAPASARRIRFRRGGSASEDPGLDEVTHAKARKHARLGGMLRARGRTAAAAAEYTKSLAISDEPVVASKLARTLLELGDYGRAAELARPLVARDPDDASAAVTLGLALTELGDPGATEAFELALRTSPFDPAVRCGLAAAYALTNSPKTAREARACTTLK